MDINDLLERLPHRDWLCGSPQECPAQRLVAELRTEGYAHHTIDIYIRAVAHFAHWAMSEGLAWPAMKTRRPHMPTWKPTPP